MSYPFNLIVPYGAMGFKGYFISNFKLIMIANILKSNMGRIIISAILGFGLAALFRRVCEGNNCFIIKSPPHSEIDGRVFGFDKKCYHYKSESTKCAVDGDK